MRPHLRAVLTALALAACADPSGTSGGRQGLLRFDYAGSVTGSYRAEAPSPDTTGTGSYALARDMVFGLEIASRGAPETPPVLSVRIFTNQKRTGPYPVATLCDVMATSRCAAAQVRFPVDPATGTRPLYLLTSGTLTITSLNSRRVRGTFSGTAQRGGSQIQVQNGEFDVPVVPF